jgi:TetR/AcrR family transcriptional regulator, transcriptional repressor for nem operon
LTYLSGITIIALVSGYCIETTDASLTREFEMAKDQNPTATRQAILDAAFNLFNHNGFQATGLSEIGERAQVSKGAIYNHFPSKLELGYAIVDEVLHEHVCSHWMAPYHELQDPIEATILVMENAKVLLSECSVNLGCPLNNLVQEMASIDEGFRSRLNKLTLNWVQTVASSFERARKSGYLRSDINTTEVAGFVVSVFEGTMSLVKGAQSIDYLEQNTRQLLTYLNPLRKRPLAECDSQSKSEAPLLELARRRPQYDTTPNLYDEEQG